MKRFWAVLCILFTHFLLYFSDSVNYVLNACYVPVTGCRRWIQQESEREVIQQESERGIRESSYRAEGGSITGIEVFRNKKSMSSKLVFMGTPQPERLKKQEETRVR